MFDLNIEKNKKPMFSYDNFKDLPRIIWNFLYIFLDKYLFALAGICFLCSAIFASFNGASDLSLGVQYLLSFSSFTAYSEMRNDVKFSSYIIFAIPFILVVAYLGAGAGDAFWRKMLSWQVSKNIVIDLNSIFQNIPFNDPSITRAYTSETLTWALRLVYNTGFVLAAILPIFRAALSKDLKKMYHYLLSAHVIQIFLISPFYIIFHLQEVWYVNGHADALVRELSPSAAASLTLNCLPSMHTSIAFAMFLLVLREKNKLFKWVWGTYCLSVIYSTMYLEIHWTIDVIAGLILGYLTVKLVDFIMLKAYPHFVNIFGKKYYKVDPNSVEIHYTLDVM